MSTFWHNLALFMFNSRALTKNILHILTSPISFSTVQGLVFCNDSLWAYLDLVDLMNNLHCLWSPKRFSFKISRWKKGHNYIHLFIWINIFFPYILVIKDLPIVCVFDMIEFPHLKVFSEDFGRTNCIFFLLKKVIVISRSIC